MSTVDSLLVVASSAIVRDIYQQILNPNLKLDQLTGFSRKVTFAMAIFALIIALTVAVTTPERTIFWFVIFGWSGIAASFCPMMILSLFWKGYTERGAIASMLVGFISIPFFKFVAPKIAGVGIYFEGIAELGPAFLCSLIAGYVVSRFFGAK